MVKHEGEWHAEIKGGGHCETLGGGGGGGGRKKIATFAIGMLQPIPADSDERV